MEVRAYLHGAIAGGAAMDCLLGIGWIPQPSYRAGLITLSLVTIVLATAAAFTRP